MTFRCRRFLESDALAEEARNQLPHATITVPDWLQTGYIIKKLQYTTLLFNNVHIHNQL